MPIKGFQKNCSPNKVALLIGFLMIMGFPSLSDGQSLKTYFDHAVFQRNSDQSYLELYFQIPAQSLKLQTTSNNDWKGTAKINIELTRKNETNPEFEKSYRLSTSKIKDTARANFYLTDLQRIRVKKDGNYQLNVSIQDQHVPKEQITIEKSIPIFFPDQQTAISDLQLVDSLYYTDSRSKFTKSNYQLLPNASHIVNEHQQNLYCYAEIYNTSMQVKDDDSVLLRFEIRESKGGKAKHFSTYKRNVQPRISLIGKIQTKELQPGHYHITFKVLDDEERFLAAKQTKILKAGKQEDTTSDQNPWDTTAFRALINDFEKDSLVKYINWVNPIADRKEGQATQKLFAGDTVMSEMQDFFIEFWERRDSVYPNKEWQHYKSEVERVNHHFSTPLYEGYETDRGRVYLQYGPPNTIYRSRDDPNFKPYRIWHYFSTANQGNVKFVFYSQSFLEEDFVLLHSNALRELRNPQWKERLNRNIDGDDPFGNKPGFDFIK